MLDTMLDTQTELDTGLESNTLDFDGGLSPSELLEITVDTKLMDNLNNFELTPAQIAKIKKIPEDAPKKSGKSVVRLWIDNAIKANERALKENQQEKAKLEEVDLLIKADEEAKGRINEAKKAIANWLRSQVIHYISGENLYICFEKKYSTKEHSYDREWVYLSNDEVMDRYDIFARDMGLDETIKDLLTREGSKLTIKDVCIENGLYYNHITSTDKKNLSRFYFNKLDIERRFWINEAEEYKQLVASNVECHLRPELNTLFKSVTGGKQENFDHLMAVLSWKIHKHYNSSQLPLIMIYGEEGVGKGIIFEYLLPTLVHGIHGSAETKVDALDGFNKMIEGKVFIALNESEASTAAQFASALKRVIGNSRIFITPKGKDSYPVDNTALYFAFTNDPKGALDLNPNAKANRRYSIIKVNEPLENWVERDGFIEEHTQLKEWVNDELVPICTSRKEMAIFAKWLYDNYPPETMPRALHGEDYQELLSTKLSQADQYLDDLLMKMKALKCGIGKEYGRCKYNDMVNAVKDFLMDRGEPHKDAYIDHLLAAFIARNGLKRHVEVKSMDGEKVRNTVAWKVGKCFDLKNNMLGGELVAPTSNGVTGVTF